MTHPALMAAAAQAAARRSGASGSSGSASSGSGSSSTSSSSASSGTSSTGSASSSASSGTASGSSSSGGGSSSAQSAYDTVRLKLTPFLQTPATPPASAGDAALLQEAQYLMAVFADDVFLNLAWPGQASWQQAPLEQEYFGTSVGGTKVFSDVQQILIYPDPSDLPVAKMDLTILGLGFEGMYRGDPDGPSELAALRAQLWTLLAAADPAESASGGHLFPEAYRHTLDQGVPSTLPSPWGWLAAFVLVFLVWLAASYPIWQRETAELVETLGQIAAPGG